MARKNQKQAKAVSFSLSEEMRDKLDNFMKQGKWKSKTELLEFVINSYNAYTGLNFEINEIEKDIKEIEYKISLLDKEKQDLVKKKLELGEKIKLRNNELAGFQEEKIKKAIKSICQTKKNREKENKEMSEIWVYWANELDLSITDLKLKVKEFEDNEDNSLNSKINKILNI